MGGWRWWDPPHSVPPQSPPAAPLQQSDQAPGPFPAAHLLGECRLSTTVLCCCCTSRFKQRPSCSPISESRPAGGKVVRGWREDRERTQVKGMQAARRGTERKCHCCSLHHMHAPRASPPIFGSYAHSHTTSQRCSPVSGSSSKTRNGSLISSMPTEEKQGWGGGQRTGVTWLAVIDHLQWI